MLDNSGPFWWEIKQTCLILKNYRGFDSALNGLIYFVVWIWWEKFRQQIERDCAYLYKMVS
jgi:hypothetical protein